MIDINEYAYGRIKNEKSKTILALLMAFFLVFGNHVPAFSRIDTPTFEQAVSDMLSCGAVFDAGTPVGERNERNMQLLALARERELPVRASLSEMNIR